MPIALLCGVASAGDLYEDVNKILSEYHVEVRAKRPAKISAANREAWQKILGEFLPLELHEVRAGLTLDQRRGNVGRIGIGRTRDLRELTAAAVERLEDSSLAVPAMYGERADPRAR